MTSVNRLRIANTRLAVIHQDTIVRYRGVTFVVIEPGLVVFIRILIRYAAGTFRRVNICENGRQIRRTPNSADGYNRITFLIRKAGLRISDSAFVVIVAARIFRGVVEPRLLILNLIFVVRIDSRERHRTASSF